MKKLNLFLIASMVAGVAACVSEDQRPLLKQPYLDLANNDSGLGELCGEGWNACGTGLTCYDERDPYPDYCLYTDMATACTPSTCGDGFCIARRGTADDAVEADIVTSCNCDGGLVFDGTTCVANPTPAEPAGGTVDPNAATESVESCPAAEIAPGVPDESTADCPTGSTCVGGTCWIPFVELDGTLAGYGAFDNAAAIVGLDATDVECQRVYGTDTDGDNYSDGVRLVVSGTLAGTLIPGATEIVFEVGSYPAEDGGLMRVWPQDSRNLPSGDSGIVDFTVTGGAGYGEDGIGGDVNLNFASGDDADEDGVLDNGTGMFAGDFAVWFDATDYVTGTFVVECGNNVVN